MTRSLHLTTPVGPMTVTAARQAITDIRFGTDLPGGSERCTAAAAPPLLREAARQLEEYFAGQRRTFDLPLAPAGSAFQRTVWEALRTIPYGQTRTYKQIAEQIGHHRAFRAVGMANNRNPLAVVVPCHRVIGCDGKLTGYAAGLSVKERLLALERTQRPEAAEASEASEAIHS